MNSPAMMRSRTHAGTGGRVKAGSGLTQAGVEGVPDASES